MKEENKSKETEQRSLLRELTEDAFFENPAASVNECTGITPRVPSNEGEAKAYTDIYDVPISSVDGAAQYKKLIRAKKRFLNKR